jgi:hypothetical protein
MPMTKEEREPFHFEVVEVEPEEMEEEEELKVFEKIMELHEAELLEQVGPDRKVNWGWGMSDNSVASKVYATETKPQLVFCTEHDDEGNLISWDLEER